MPVNRKAWASWNFLGSSAPGSETSAVCVSYWANLLQHLPPGSPDLFVTLNPPAPPAADKTCRHLKLAHPVFSFASWQAQSRVSELQGAGGNASFFAGAWCGYGFHEDGIRAAVSAVTAMGGSIPWTCRATSPKFSLAQRCMWLPAFDKFVRGMVRTGYVRLILPNGEERRYGDEGAAAAASAVAAAGSEAWRGRPALSATLRVYDMDFFRKVVSRHDTGLGEAYMAGVSGGGGGVYVIVITFRA